jgi:hypothetical protein
MQETEKSGLKELLAGYLELDLVNLVYRTGLLIEDQVKRQGAIDMDLANHYTACWRALKAKPISEIRFGYEMLADDESAFEEDVAIMYFREFLRKDKTGIA